MTQPINPRNQPLRADVPRGAVEPPSGSASWFWFWFLTLASFPRVCILGFWIFGSQIGDAFSGWVVPTVGFFIAPSTTLAYALIWGASSNGVSGAEWLVVAAGVLLDVLTWGALQRARAR